LRADPANAARSPAGIMNSGGQAADEEQKR
jgi:hypothetical protein